MGRSEGECEWGDVTVHRERSTHCFSVHSLHFIHKVHVICVGPMVVEEVIKILRVLQFHIKTF